MEIVDHVRTPQQRILNGLLQRKSLRVERDEAIADRPVLHRILEDDVLVEHDHANVFELLQARENLLHWLRLRLLGHRTDADQHLLAGVGRDAAVGVDAIVGVAQIDVALHRDQR